MWEAIRNVVSKLLRASLDRLAGTRLLEILRSCPLTRFLPLGKETITTHLAAGEFSREESLAAIARLSLATATAVSACTAL
jgi:hypothetical protein